MTSLSYCLKICTRLYSRSVSTLSISTQPRLKNVFGFSRFQYSTNTDNDETLDSNELALKNLDITLLKPHPEWRNVAAGPVLGDNIYEKLWSHFRETGDPEVQSKVHDEKWEEYKEEFGFSPIDYLDSEEYEEFYPNGIQIWKNYFRNKKGAIQTQKPRKSCIKNGKRSSGSPCPLCKNPKILITYNNVRLLRQYIDEVTGELINPLRTGSCGVRHQQLTHAIYLAETLGYLPKNARFIKFNLEDYKVNYAAL